jgi:hypothetical protein
MTTSVSIRIEQDEANRPRFRAVAGRRQSVGRTAGEALDALIAQEGGHIECSAVLVQRFAPDAFFTQAQHDRMQELLARRDSLTAGESTELDALIDAELDATVSRTDPLMPAQP